jgi:hypothetical protein
MNARIRVMLDSREIEELAAADEEVAGMWRKATRAFRSAGAEGLDDDMDSRFTLLYQSALQGATAVVRAAGYRVRGESNHHITFATVAALGSADLSDAARDLNVMRQRRHAAVYDWETTIGAEQVEQLREAAVRLLRAAESWLRRKRDSLAPMLAPLVVPD